MSARVRSIAGPPAALVVMLALLGAACAEHLPDQDLRILDTAPSAKTSPEALWKEFDADKRGSGRKYHGKAIDITGKISSIVQDVTGSRILFNVQPPPATAAVEARLLADHAAATLAGLTVLRRLTLRCFVEGMDKNVILKSCVKL
jgi:hypothetical protein